jgi:tetratricopeptide (TPR) repeat protein
LTVRFLVTSLLCAGILHAQAVSPREDLETARKAEQSGDLPRAEAIYEKILTRSPSADMYQRLGLVRHLQNKFSEAAKAFDKALDLNPGLWTSHLFLGIDYYRMNRFAEALTNLKSADSLRPGQPETLFWLGAANLALHQYWDGFEDLETVLEKDPNNADALRLLAEAYANRGTQLLNQVAEKYPDSPAGLQVQGRAFEFEGSYEAALRFYRAAAAKDPKRAGIKDSIIRLISRTQ